MIGNRADSICLVALSPQKLSFRSMSDAAHIDNRPSGALGRSQVVGVVVAESGSLGGVTIPEHYARDIVERRGDRVHRLKNARENGPSAGMTVAT